MSIVDFLPNETNPHFVYDQGPWWCMIHYLMQAVSVFLLSLSYHSSTSQDSILWIYYVRKVVRWLRAMQEPVAERAYSVALSLFETVAKSYSLDLSDLLEVEDPIAARGGRTQHTGFGPTMVACLPAHFISQATSTEAPIAVYPAYRTATTNSALSAHSGVSLCNES
jgi:hypothetical protein